MMPVIYVYVLVIFNAIHVICDIDMLATIFDGPFFNLAVFYVRLGQGSPVGCLFCCSRTTFTFCLG